MSDEKQENDVWHTCTNHDDMCFTNTGELLVATSSLTHRYWNGMISLYENLTDNDANMEIKKKNKLMAAAKSTTFSENTITNINHLSQSNRAVTTHDSGELMMWQLSQDGTEMIQMFCKGGHDDAILSLDVNTDQSSMATTSTDCQLKIWSVDECVTEASYTGHTEAVSGVAFHPTSKQTLATASYDRNLLLWDLRKLRPVFQSYKFHSFIPSTLTYITKDSNLIMIGSESGQIITMDTRNLTSVVSKVDLHKRKINRIKFSPENISLLATCSDDLSIIVSQLETDSSLKTLYKDFCHNDFVTGVTWSPTKHNQLLSCSWDGDVYVHDVSGDSCKMAAGDA